MQKFVSFLISWRWALVVVIPLLTVVLAFGLKNAAFDGSYRIWFAPESQTLQQYDRFKELFGNDDSMIILFRDEDGIFNKKALSTIERLTQKLWQTPYIARVDSLTNYQYVHVDPKYKDEILVESFIEDASSLSQTQLKEKREIALGEDLLVNRIISADTKTTMIVARITPKGGNTIGASKTILDAVNGYLAQESATGYRFYLAGGPVVNQTFSSLAIHDVSTFTPLVILMAMGLLWVIFRKFSAMALSILVVILTFVLVMSAQVLFGYKFNNFTANMPLFIIAIGIADAMHLLWVYLHERRCGANNEVAIYESVSKNALPLFLTSVTTAIGFASLGISEIVPVATLGIATASGAIMAFVLTLFFVPAALAILNPKIAPKEQNKSTQTPKAFARDYGMFIIKYHRSIILLSLLFCLFMAFGASMLRVDSNAVRYFREDVPFRQTIAVIERDISGPISYEVVADSMVADGIKEPAFMQSVERFTGEFLAAFPEARHSASLVDVVKKFNEIVAFDKSIPEDKNLIAQYLLLYSLSLPQGMEINDKMDIDERRLRISLSMNVSETSRDLEMIAWIEDWWHQTPYSAEVNGQSVMFANMQSDVTKTLIESILLALLLISIVMFFIFKRVGMIPIILIPNILPIGLVIGAMGWLGMTIDIGVAISGAIILGIAVDDSIHFLLKYKEAQKRGYGLEDSFAFVMEYAGLAMIFTTVVLSLAFITFHFSEFMLNANFGLITAIALFIALGVDLLLLPAILALLHQRKREKSFKKEAL